MMPANDEVEVAVLGGGPAGMTAALRARELGAEVLLLEKARLGGICYNEGPAPIRTLARAARLVRDAGGWQGFGLAGGAPRVDLQAALANARRVADQAYEHKGLPLFLRAHGIELLQNVGAVRFTDAHTLALADGRSVRAASILIATGGRAGRPPIPGQELAFTYSDLWSLTALPEHVTVIGASATGCQLASIVADFGCRVDLVEGAPRIEPKSDEAVSTALRSAFERRGIGVTTGVRVERIERHAGGVVVKFRDASGQAGSIETGAVFLATGWPANVDDLDLDTAGVAMRGSYVEVNDRLQTSASHVYAIGDVNGLSMVAQSAASEGIIAAENAIFSPRRRYMHDIVPVGSFTDPEYASVGLTEAEARARFDCATATIEYDDLTRAMADGRTDGFCKLIAERSNGRLLGGHVLGEYSAEVIQLIASFMASGMSVARIAELQLAYPTFAEGVVLAARRLARDLGMVLSVTPWDDEGPHGASDRPRDRQLLADITA
jgi:pyruvate/2-oxoglutarate dehydrogenase complex dihydrolipoamide dehydrogenase (E3) component